jgi:hypothetical protein
MVASHCGAALVVLTLLLIFACGGALVACRVADYYRHRGSDPESAEASTSAEASASAEAGAKRTYTHMHALARASALAGALASAPPDMRWWRWPGYAAPLELSLPLYNYLYGYPPASRLPYNA